MRQQTCAGCTLAHAGCSDNVTDRCRPVHARARTAPMLMSTCNAAVCMRMLLQRGRGPPASARAPATRASMAAPMTPMLTTPTLPWTRRQARRQPPSGAATPQMVSTSHLLQLAQPCSQLHAWRMWRAATCVRAHAPHGNLMCMRLFCRRGCVRALLQSSRPMTTIRLQTHRLPSAHASARAPVMPPSATATPRLMTPSLERCRPPTAARLRTHRLCGAAACAAPPPLRRQASASARVAARVSTRWAPSACALCLPTTPSSSSP